MSIKKLIIAVPLILILLLSGCGYDKTGHEDYSGQSFGEHMISNYTGKAVTKISYCKSFDKAIFENYGATDAKTGSNGESLDSYDYIVFWYSAEPNSFSGKSGPGVYIYGVK